MLRVVLIYIRLPLANAYVSTTDEITPELRERVVSAHSL